MLEHIEITLPKILLNDYTQVDGSGDSGLINRPIHFIVRVDTSIGGDRFRHIT